MLTKRIARMNDKYMSLSVDLNKAYMQKEEEDTLETRTLIQQLETQVELVRQQLSALVYGQGTNNFVGDTRLLGGY